MHVGLRRPCSFSPALWQRCRVTLSHSRKNKQTGSWVRTEHCRDLKDVDTSALDAPSLLPVAVSGIVASLSLISLLLLTIAAVIFSKFT
ncbi:hypothetical protein BIW11_04241 [Tropilaelaps mercedesae]|uniref:Uncharacterized protein n=1 Tax=Tropilaelaps mercedesae TaxID=418985 RepID=A0A1V9X915_9ACAR|nr:hypothetical protein BIW11_04241 [Tropilaelaps mercedesae]